MEVMGAETLLLDLDTRSTLRLLIEPALTLDNPLQRTLGVYHFMFGKDKARMLHLKKPRHNLQPKKNCNHWNPTVSFKMRADELMVDDFELNGEQCPDEFDEGCLRNLRGPVNEFERNAGNQPEINELEAAMVRLLRESLSDDFFRVAWFGNARFEELVDADYYDLDKVDYSPDEKENFIEMMQHTDGWWAEIERRVRETGEFDKVRYVNSNDGTASGNATRPENIRDFLLQMKNSSHVLLRNWRRGRAESERPVFMVQPGLFAAYKAWLINNGTFQDFQFRLQTQGEAVHGVLMFDGNLVIEMPDWDAWDAEVGLFDEETGQSKVQRAIFTAKENLCGLANTRNLAGYSSSLMIQESPVLKDKGKKFMYGAWGLGFGIASPVLMTAAFNSSTTFA